MVDNHCVGKYFTSPVLALDIDEVLCKFCEGFAKWQTGLDIPRTADECFRLSYRPGIEATREMFLATPAFLELDPLPGSVEALQYLKRCGFILVAVTARPGSTKTATERWLARFFPNLVSALYFTPCGAKGPLCQQIGARVLVDDQLPNVSNAHLYGIYSVIFDQDGMYTWNQTGANKLPATVVRAFSWVQTANWILSLGLLRNNVRIAPMGPLRSSRSQLSLVRKHTAPIWTPPVSTPPTLLTPLHSPLSSWTPFALRQTSSLVLERDRLRQTSSLVLERDRNLQMMI